MNPTTPEQKAELIVFAWESFIMTRELSQTRKADVLLWALDETYIEEKRTTFLNDLQLLSKTIIKEACKELDDWLSR